MSGRDWWTQGGAGIFRPGRRDEGGRDQQGGRGGGQGRGDSTDRGGHDQQGGHGRGQGRGDSTDRGGHEQQGGRGRGQGRGDSTDRGGHEQQGGRGRGQGRGSSTDRSGHDQQVGRGRGQGRGSSTDRGGHDQQGGRGRGQGRGGSADRGGHDQQGGRGRGQGRGGSTGDSYEPSEAVVKLEDKNASKERPKEAPGKVGPEDAMANMSLEDRKGKGSSSDAPPRDGNDGNFPPPAYGKMGERVILRANYFDIGKVEGIVLHQYIVKIRSSPETTPRNRHRRRIFSLLLKHPALAELPIATNYVDKLICPKEIPVSDEINLPYYEEEDEPGDSTKTYSISIEQGKRFPLSDLLSHLCVECTYPDKEEAIQAMNIVLAAVPNISPNIQPVGQSKHFDIPSTYDRQQMGLSGGLYAIRGFFHSVRPSTGRLLLNLNVSTAAFYPALRLDELISEFDQDMGGNYSVVLLERFLKGLRVSISYLKKRDRNVTRVKTIFGIGKYQGRALGPADLEFSLQQPNGATKRVNVRDYFHRTYKIPVHNNTFVVDVGRSGHPVYIPADLCTVLPGQVTRQKLNSNQTSSMIQKACRGPKDNATDITERGLHLMGITKPDGEENLLSRFGISPSSQLLPVYGRVLTPPNLMYNELYTPSPGNWNLRNLAFVKPGTNKTSLGCLFLRNGTSGPSDNWVRRVLEKMKAYGIKRPQFMGTVQCEPKLGSISTRMEELKRKGVNFLVVILPSKDNALVYSHVKFLGDCRHGINTLCINPNYGSHGGTIMQEQDAYIANILLKMNLKMGGTNHELAPDSGMLEGTIYLGIDVTHPTGTESRPEAPSIAGVVANIDNGLGQWPASIRIQESRKEMVTRLKEMVIERFESWKGASAPTKVLVYRDGVSESQYQAVLDEELPQLRQAVQDYYGNESDTLPKISIVIVGKRHHTRFYPLPEAKTQIRAKSSNVKPGTVVDRGVTMDHGFDFFMVSHQGIKGTSRPAHYAVIHDDNQLGADQLQVLTHNFCYLFGRATRSVSIVPPAYYADILCERGRCYLYDTYHSDGSNNQPFDSSSARWTAGVHENLQDTMFYI